MATDESPRTIGELRRRLAELGNPWDVDLRLGDDDPLPDHPRGAQREDQVPDAHRLAVLEPSADLQAIIAAQAPTNPFLRERWREVGLLTEDDVKGSAVDANDHPEWGPA